MNIDTNLESQPFSKLFIFVLFDYVCSLKQIVVFTKLRDTIRKERM